MFVTEFYDDLTGSDDLQFKAVSGQLNVDEAQGIVECFVAAVGNKDSVGDIVAPGAFDGSLRRRKPRVVWGHDWNQPIGKVLAIEEVPASDPRLPEKMKSAGVGGLLARVQFNLRSERGREAFHSVAFFGPDQEWSIGYKTIKAAYDPGAQANVLQEVELFEVSPVLHGANQLTGTISIKAANGDERVDSFDKSQWPMFDRAFAEQIKSQHPDVWDKGGNIKGDDQYQILTKIAEQGGKARTEDQIKALELREAWIARHRQDFQLPGVVAQMKWLAIGTRGEDHMKKTVRAAIAKMSEKGYGYGDDDDDVTPIRRVRMLVDPYGYGQILNGRNRHHVSFEALHGNGSHLTDMRPGIGQAVANHVGSPIQLRMTDDNFVLYDVADADGEEDTYFLPYHFDGQNYMFGEAKQVEVEINVNFDTDDEDDDEYEDDWSSNESGVMRWNGDLEDWDDEDEKYVWADADEMEGKAIGTAIGPMGPKGNPDDTVDHDGDGMIFDGTPNEQRAPKKRRGPAGPAGPGGPAGTTSAPGANAQQRNARAVARLQRMRRDINRQGSTPQGERRAGERMRQVGAFLRAAEANDRARAQYGDGQGPSGPQGPRDTTGGNRPEADAAVRNLQERRRQINERGSTPGGERAAGREMQDVGRFLRAAEANDRARNGTPAGPAGPSGRPGQVDRMTAAQRRRAAVARLERVRAEANRRGGMRGDERRSGDEVREVGRFLRAAEQNERTRARQVAGRSAGPAGARGPNADYGMSQSGRTPDNYDGNAARMDRGFQQRRFDEYYYDAPSGERRRNVISNVRTPYKSYDDPALTFWEVSDLEVKALRDPSLTLEDLEEIETKGVARTIARLVPNAGMPGGRRNGRWGRDGDGDGVTGEAERAAREAARTGGRGHRSRTDQGWAMTYGRERLDPKDEAIRDRIRDLRNEPNSRSPRDMPSAPRGRDPEPKRPRRRPERSPHDQRWDGIINDALDQRDDPPGRGISDDDMQKLIDRAPNIMPDVARIGDDNPFIRKGPSRFVYLPDGMRIGKPLQWEDMNEKQRAAWLRAVGAGEKKRRAELGPLSATDRFGNAVDERGNPVDENGKPMRVRKLDASEIRHLSQAEMDELDARRKGKSAFEDDIFTQDELLDYLDSLTDDELLDLDEKGLLGRIGRTLTGRGDTHIGDGGGKRVGRGRLLRGRDPSKVVDRNKNGRIFDGTPDEMAAVVRSLEDTPNEPWKINETDRGIGESGAEVFRNAHEAIIDRRADRWVPHYATRPGGRSELERIRDEKNRHIVKMEERIDKGEKLSAKDRDSLVDALAHVSAIDDALDRPNSYRLREDERGIGESSAEMFMREHEGQISRAAERAMPHFSRMTDKGRESHRDNNNAQIRRLEDKLDEEGSLSGEERDRLIRAIATVQAIDEAEQNLSRYPSRRAPSKTPMSKEEAAIVGNPKQVGRALKRDGKDPKLSGEYGISDDDAADLVGKVTSFDDPQHRGVRLGGVITEAEGETEYPLDENGSVRYGENTGSVRIWVTHANGELLPPDQQFLYDDIDGQDDNTTMDHFVSKNGLRIHDR